MKTITKQVEQTFYVCEGCGGNFSNAGLASSCEKDHKRKSCQHDGDFTYKFTSYYGERAKLERTCNCCGEVTQLFFDDHGLTPAQAKIVWEMLEGEK